MKRIAILLLGLTGAVAQPAPPTESATVTGERTREEQIQSFVQSRAAASVRLGKIARWEAGICPAAAGLKPELVRFVLQRLKTIAAKVGAPVNPHASCRTNVEIVFTPAPQALLDNVRKNQEDYLGYHANAAQAARLAKVTHTIQAWYATGTIDSNGSVQADLKRRGMPFCMDEPECRIVTDVPPSAVTGSRLNNGLHSGFLNVIIVADRGKLLDQEIGAVADYISVLALSQPGSLDDCAALLSILNLLAPGCVSAASVEISAADENYLRGLYRMTPDALLSAQRGEIAYRMKQTLEGR
jgi:hypothetical protein